MQTIDQWFNQSRNINAHIGVPGYAAHRHLILQVCRGNEVVRSGSVKMLDLVGSVPNADSLLTKEQFRRIRGKVLRLVAK